MLATTSIVKYNGKWQAIVTVIGHNSGPVVWPVDHDDLNVLLTLIGGYLLEQGEKIAAQGKNSSEG